MHPLSFSEGSALSLPAGKPRRFTYNPSEKAPLPSLLRCVYTALLIAGTFPVAKGFALAPDNDAPAKCLQKFNFFKKLNFSAPDKSGAAPKPIYRQNRPYKRKIISSKTTPGSAGVSPFRAPDSSGGVVVKAWLQPGVTLQNRLKPPLQPRMPRIVTRYAAP